MSRLALSALLLAASSAGALAANAPRTASPAAAPKAQIIDLGALTDAQIGAIVPNLGTLRTKTLVTTPNGAVSVQTGDVPKHMHLDSLEIQYIISGSGTFWLGDKKREIHPGDLIIIPEGTAHAGSHPTSGEFKALVIKLPPPVPGDYHPLK